MIVKKIIKTLGGDDEGHISENKIPLEQHKLTVYKM